MVVKDRPIGRKRAEQEVRLLLSITQAVTEAKDFGAAIESTLARVCEATGWNYAEAWTPDAEGNRMELSPAWYGKSRELARFNAASKAFNFSPGAGIPGRVWKTKESEWHPDISILPKTQYLRVGLALEAGLKAMLAIPIVADGEVLAVLAFYMFEARERDARTVEVVSAVANHLASALRHKRTEETLRKNEALLQAIVDNSTRVIYLKDRAGRYVAVNRQYERLFHITRDEIAGKSDYDVFPKDRADLYRQNDLKVFEAGVPMEFEEVAVLDDGPHIYTSNKFPLFDSAGKIYAVCGISTDITEQKRQEERLRAARDQLDEEVRNRTAELARANKALLAAADERERTLERLQEERDFSASLINTAQVIVLLLDTDGQIAHFNPYFEKITGYTLGEVKDRDWFSTFLPTRDQQRIRDLFQTALNGARTRGNVNSIVTKDGREREIEWFDETLKDADGNMLGLLCIGLDITERRRAESWLQGLVQTTQDALVSIDRRGRVVLFNPAAERIFGYTAREVAGQKVNLLMAEPYGLEHDGYITRYETTREAFAIGRIRTVKARRKNGEIFPIELSVTEIPIDDEIRYAAFIRDISEKVYLQEQLLESERLAAIGTTAAKIGHELANPLNGMYLAVQLLEQQLARRTPASGESAESTVKKIKSEIVRLNKLLQEFRSLSRREKYNFQPITLHALVADVMEMELPRCSALGIEVEHVVPADLPPILADADKLKQALLNLCNNAADAMPRGGTITVRGSATDDSIVLEIADTGGGIPPQLDAFEPFTTSKPQGTGLGLVIVRQIITGHGGTITYDSRPGKGSTFRITLPRNWILAGE